MFDEKFIEAIENRDIEKFHQWIIHHGVENVVANSGQKSVLHRGKNWLTVLMHYGPTLHKWAVSDLCSQQTASFVLEHNFLTLILYDDKAELAKKCDAVFAQKMFHKTPLSLWGALFSMIEKNQTGLLLHIFSHKDFQKHLTLFSRDSRNGMEEFFKKTIVSSRNTEGNQSWWSTFRNNTPKYHNSWATAYMNALTYYDFSEEVGNFLSSSAFLAWDTPKQFLKHWGQHHTLISRRFSAAPKFLDSTVLPLYYGQLLWNNIALNDQNRISSLIETFASSTTPFHEIVLGCLQSAERAVKGLKPSAKQKALIHWNAENAMAMLFDALDEEMIATLMPHKNDLWDLLNITNHPYVLACVLKNEVGDGQWVHKWRKL